MRVGDRAEVRGSSDPGLFAPSIAGSSIRLMGRGSVPPARPVTYDDLIGGAQDSQWIELRGVVHSAKILKTFGHDSLFLGLQLGGGRAKVVVLDFAGIDYNHMTDSTIVVRGVCFTDFNEKRQYVGVGLFVPNSGDIEIVEPARPNPFDTPTTPIRNALQFGQGRHLVKVTGTATYQVPGHALYLQDGNDGIRIQSASTELVEPGRRVEAIGFPAMGEYAPMLEDGSFRIVGKGPPIPPRRIEARDVIGPRAPFGSVPYDEQLVQLQGTVAESHKQADQLVWTLRQGSDVFKAYLPLSVATSRENTGSGSVLLLTGICTIRVDRDRNPVSFGILLRSPQDMVILRQAPWWTAERTLLLLAGLAGVTVVVILWVVVLRGRVEQQTRIIRESEARFRNLAEHDSLTGLPNRLMLEDRIAECLAQCKSESLTAVLFTIDIDRFKQINDTYGHPIGDEILKIVAKRLLSKVRRTDTIARTGGEEFTLVVGPLKNADSAAKIATGILDLFHDSVLLPGQEVRVTVSIGGAIYPDDGFSAETLRKQSDQALYEAKRTGRNRAVFASRELCVSSELASAVEAALREALRSNKFLLHYQPIYDATGAVRRFEALLRTSDEMLNTLGPSKFIPVAEECGLIIPLGRWVIEEACRQILAWRSLGMYPCAVAVNVSGKQLVHKGFAEHVLQVLERCRIDPRLLELELTETTAMTELASVADTVASLARAGLTFAIDDFGTGYSSLSRLHELRITTLKIDRSFIEGLETNNTSSTIVLAIIQMAKSLRLQVVAEGVENDDQFAILRDLGCHLYQGYSFSRPLPAARATALLMQSPARLLAEASAD
jgi:diguanylate cyclase (GGDEF)-like protein